MIARPLWILAIALAGLNACTVIDPVTTPARPVPAPASVVRSTADDLVAYVAVISAMTDSALAAEAARQRREPNDLARVKAALALSLTLQAEESEILSLVEATAKKENIDRDLRAMASYLQAVAVDRRKLRETATTAGARLRDERRAHDAQKQRAEALQQKLDALTDLEKSLAARPSMSR